MVGEMTYYDIDRVSISTSTILCILIHATLPLVPIRLANKYNLLSSHYTFSYMEHLSNSLFTFQQI